MSEKQTDKIIIGEWSDCSEYRQTEELLSLEFQDLFLFLVSSEYLQVFLGIPDTGILPDTSVIYHDSP